MRTARTRTIASAAAIAASALVMAGVATDALRDRADAALARAELARARDALAVRGIDEATARTMGAAVALQPMLDGPWFRHAWTRSVGAGTVAQLRGDLSRAVADLEAAIESRRTRVAALASMRADLDGSTTLAQVDAVEARRAPIAAELELDAAPGHADLVREIEARRRGFGADLERNRQALESLRAARERARGDARALQAVVDAVLPVPPRAGEDALLADVRASAAAERAAILGANLLDAARRDGDAATTAADVATIATRIERDPDLARGDASLLERRAAAVEALRHRQRALERWERSVSDVDASLAAAEFGAAARAMARLAPCDARTDGEASSLRTGFGRRAVDGLARAALSAVDRADTELLARLSGPFGPGGSVRAWIEPSELATLDEVRARVERFCDRSLYEQFCRSPSPMAAARYLEGWPAVRRAMAPAVALWRRAALEPASVVTLEEIRWGALGVAAVTRGLEDRPDARVTLAVDGAPVADLRVSDIREGGSNGFNDAAARVAGFPWADLEVGVVATIDLRDAILSDPRPRGLARQRVDAWRAARREEVAFSDPSWPGCRHVAVIRVAVPKTPPLPPFQGRQQ
jgi:hypothetical protein